MIAATDNQAEFQPGDIFACYGSDWVSCAISVGTFSPFAPRGLRIGPSHVAICCGSVESPYWVESTTLADRTCQLTGRQNPRGCQMHGIGSRLHDYTDAGGFVDVYRLTPIDTLSDSETATLNRILIDHFVQEGIDYDMGGALISGTRVLKRTRLLRSRVESVFCSELIAATLMRLGRMNRDNPTKFNPATLLRRVVRTGVYAKVRTYE